MYKPTVIFMISDACFEYRETGNHAALAKELLYYLADPVLSRMYTNDVRARCLWILGNPGHPDIASQVAHLINDLA